MFIESSFAKTRFGLTKLVVPYCDGRNNGTKIKSK